eukprot:gnl/TRDRNA2_/TRDRNA2_193176_c0_seq1.p1 gnl/TRDRNA2_/TRDRNA2_193176_c0~~gnl/TRDRNA2_/TRDRNA2_193176_c0_seq1.p1  ORF type:complete len:534 (+),score=38.62 gnl/TRDRNA2_/TRDRNA2_193176_c0_seq1:236-1603(+)
MGDNRFIAQKATDGCFVLRSATDHKYAVVPLYGTARNNVKLAFYPNSGNLEDCCALCAVKEGDNKFVLKHRKTGLYVHPRGGGVPHGGTELVFYSGHPGPNGCFKATPAFGSGSHYGGMSSSAVSASKFPKAPKCHCGSNGLPGSPRYQLTQEEAQLLLDTINKYRSCAEPPIPLLEWDCGVQCVAQSWADTGAIRHSASCNARCAWQGTGDTSCCQREAVKYRLAKLDDGSKSWVAENMDGWIPKDWPVFALFRLLDTAHDGRHEMDYHGPHYSSMMWADSTKFGCGWGTQDHGRLYCDIAERPNLANKMTSSRGGNYNHKMGSKYAACSKEGRVCIPNFSRSTYRKKTCPNGESFRALISQKSKPSGAGKWDDIVTKFDVEGLDLAPSSDGLQLSLLATTCLAIFAGVTGLAILSSRLLRRAKSVQGASTDTELMNQDERECLTGSEVDSELQ